MTDREILMWLHERLEHLHGENPSVDYMHALRRIIARLPVDQRAEPFGSSSLEDLKKRLAERGY